MTGIKTAASAQRNVGYKKLIISICNKSKKKAGNAQHQIMKK